MKRENIHQQRKITTH